NKTNAGTLQFSGAAPNTYAGNTTVNAGELILAKNAGVNAIAGDVIINGGLLTLQNNEQIANTSIMTINGGTFAMGPFTETIATLNYLGGNFSQSGGNLILASAGNALTMRNTTLNGNVTTTGGGSIVFDATNNGTAQMLGTLNLSGPTIFDIQNGTAAEDMVIHSTITSGGVIKNNTGTLVLLGPNTYGGGTTINGGVLQGTTTSLQGAITTNAAGTLAFNQAFDGTFTGTISGAGDLVKDGTGTVIFPSPTAQTVGGTTTINGGTLQVDGTLTGTGGTTIGANGTLAGTGTVISNISNFGTIAPGSGGIGTLSVTGNITMQSGSTLDMELTPTTTDLLNVSGTFTIDPNATFFFTPLVGDYTSGQTYTVVQGGVINGTFTQVNDPFPLFQGTLIHQANAILLQLELLPISSLPNLDSNAAKVAACLDAENPQPGEDLFDVVGSLRFLSTEEAIDKALLQMQPSPFVSLAVIKQESTGYIRNALYERLELRARECAEEKTGYGFWLAPLMGVSEQEKRHKGPGYNALTPGIALGFDGFIWDAFQVGGALGYTNSDITWKSKRGVGRTQGIYASLYGRYGTEVAFVESALIGGYDYYTTKREIKMGGLLPLHRHAKGSHHGFEGSAHLKGVIQLPVGQTKLGPYLGVDFLYSREGSYTETGARSLNLKVEGKSNTMLLSEGGMNISHCIILQRKTLTPFAQIGAIWENRFAGKEIESHLTACTLKNIGYYPSRLLFGASGGLNVKWGLKTAPKASLFYKGKYGQGYQDHSFTLELIY
ncbi:MAG: autotransporter domain-containing protein, partial [Chlamydiia bacterium]|nr:autotransporter domain-containing protein [Chlamydiia bacterium]